MNTVVAELVSGYCNSKCLWCFTQYKCINRMTKGMIPFEDFKKLIDLNHKDRFNIIPYSHGEALLNPEFATCCQYALDKGFPLASIHTNLAMSLSEEILQVLAKFHSVTVNVGGVTEATHNLNMGTTLGVVIENLRHLRKRSSQLIAVKMVINKNNIDEINLLHELVSWINPNISVNTYPLYFSPADSDDEDKWKFYQSNMEGNSKVECRDMVVTDGGRVEVKPKTDKCYGLIPTVRFNGNLEICCRGRYLERSLGNCFEVPLKKLIESREYKQAVKEGLNREYIQYCAYCS